LERKAKPQTKQTMITTKTKLLVIAASVLALASGANAQTALTPNVSVSGFATADWNHVNTAADDTFNIGSALVTFTGTYKPVTGVVSFYYKPGSSVAPSDSDLHVLDINATWDLGSGWTIEGGRFLSWMGYESFFNINNPEITFANTVGGFIPGYEDGVRVVYTDKDWNAGFALVDSAYATNGSLISATGLAGDGELKKNYAVEAYLNYTGISNLNAWLGVSHQDKTGFVGAPKNGVTTVDLYGQYQVTKEFYAAAEYTIEDNVAPVDSSTWLVLGDYTFNDQVSAAVRISGDTYNGATADDLKYTFAPTYTVNKNFSVRGEISYLITYGKVNPDSTFLGVEAVFKF
jgi:hypothetical protein